MGKAKRIKISIILFLGLAAFACSGGGGGGGGSSPTSSTSSSSASAGQAVTVEIFDFEFRPKSLEIQPGQTVRWILRGNDRSHTTTEQNGLWSSGSVFTQDGATFERTFSAQDEGRTFLYYCTSHQGCCQMQGSIRVGSRAPPPDPDY